MRTTQEIFDFIIQRTNYYNSSNRFMCNSLEFACVDKVITVEEYTRCAKEIEEFIVGDEFSTLSCFVKRSVLERFGEIWNVTSYEKFVHCRTIYENWDKREEFLIPKQYRK